MSETKCSNYDVCKQYGTYGYSCEEDLDNSTYTDCDNSEKQIIKILASIDQKLSKLLEK
ncbi:hypothetical protein LAD12857_42410 [Lacrimispora amygdalina]|uniref:Uncharacterized protein n=1 Tax=Lacrimispora amygdalina TaxID=253257 RepID=A0ABQ5MCP8_9FIRM|nr:hypothetical protein [Clostridium indicum]